MNEPTEDGGGPAGVVEGFEGWPFETKSVLCLSDAGVEGAKGLDGGGAVHVDMMIVVK